MNEYATESGCFLNKSLTEDDSISNMSMRRCNDSTTDATFIVFYDCNATEKSKNVNGLCACISKGKLGHCVLTIIFTIRYGLS